MPSRRHDSGSPSCRASAVATLGAVFLVAAAASAQVSEPARQAPAMPEWDAAASLGWFNVRTVSISHPGTYTRWHPDSASAAFSLGHYWTEHVKLEVDAGLSTSITTYHWEPYPPEVGVGCCQTRVDSTRFGKLSAGVIYQFRHNAMFHPFVGAGIDVDFERTESLRPAQDVWAHAGPVAAIPEHRTETRRVSPGVFGVAGYKAYVSERVFFRNDARFSTGRAPDQFTVRFGFGIDF